MRITNRRFNPLIKPIVLAVVVFCVSQSPPSWAQNPFWGFSKPAPANKLEPTVAVGMNRILQAGNGRLACYDRNGALM